jgi:hypothetical protein
MDQHRKGTEGPLHARLSNAAACEWQKWRSTIVRYCLRPQPAAEMRADGELDSGEISSTLGRLSDAIKSTYGHANMWEGRGLAPARVTAALEVKVRAVGKMKQLVRKTK